jgi:hypothetical protein
MYFTSSCLILQLYKNYVRAFYARCMQTCLMTQQKPETKKKTEKYSTLNELIIVWRTCREQIQANTLIN